MTEYTYEGPKRASSAVTWSFAGQNLAADSVYPFSSFIGGGYQSTVQAAFARWSAVSGLTFTQVADSSSAGIRVGFGMFSQAYVVGETTIRSINGLLPSDTVLRLLDPAADPLSQNGDGTWVYANFNLTLYQIAVHEIGHALGLGHTTNPATIMYPIASDLNRDLAAGDIQGINNLYPYYTVTPTDPVQPEGNSGTTAFHFVITRHNDLNLTTTVNYQIAGAAFPGLTGTVAAAGSEFVGGALPSGQLTFAAGAASVTLTVAVAGNTSVQPDQGFAVSLSIPATGAAATVRGSTNAAILDDDGAASINGNTLSIYRFFDGSDGTHFFTASLGERNAVLSTRPDLVYEGAQLNAVAKPAADPSASAVFRFFDSRFGTHFYTSSSAERDAVIGSRADLAYEGIGFYEHAAPQSGDSAVFRFFDSRSGTHFFTGTVAERAMIQATRPDFTDEGVAFYAPASA